MRCSRITNRENCQAASILSKVDCAREELSTFFCASGGRGASAGRALDLSGASPPGSMTSVSTHDAKAAKG